MNYGRRGSFSGVFPSSVLVGVAGIPSELSPSNLMAAGKVTPGNIGLMKVQLVKGMHSRHSKYCITIFGHNASMTVMFRDL